MFVPMKQAQFLVLGCLAVASMLVTTGLRAEPVDAVVVSFSGAVEAAPPQTSSYAALKVGEKLPEGSTVRTGPGGKVVLQATPGSAVEVGSDSILKINELAFHKAGGAVTERKARLELSSGVVNALIDPSTPTVTDFQVETPEGVAAARGTFYTVMVRNGKTYTQVNEGKVAAIAAHSRGSL